MKALGRQIGTHTLGLAVQVLTATPLVLFSIAISRKSGGTELDAFVQTAAVSAILYTVSLLGLRSSIILDKFDTFGVDLLKQIRWISTIALGIIGIAIGIKGGLSINILVTIYLIRCGDALLELMMTIDMIKSFKNEYLTRQLIVHSIKNLGILGALTLSVYPINNITVEIIAMGTAIVHVCISLILLKNTQKCNSQQKLYFTNRETVNKLIKNSTAFLAAQITCGFLTAYPRISINTKLPIDDGQAAAALTVATLIGMVFFTSWIRWATKISDPITKKIATKYFILEVVFICTVGACLIVLIGDWPIRKIYELPPSKNYEIVTILIASTVLFGIMTLANIFKFTRFKWMETITYLSGLLSAFIMHAYGEFVTPAGILFASIIGMGTAMLSFLIISKIYANKK